MQENDLIFLKNYFKNSDIKKWVTNETSDEKIIYYTSKSTQKLSNKLVKHFNKYFDILVNRNVRSGTELITKEIYEKYLKNLHEISYVMVASAFKRGEFYCISYAREQKYFECPKIIAPQRSNSNTFGYNDVSWYGGTDIHFIVAKDKSYDLKYILALLNSKLYYFWLYHKGKRKGENLELVLKPLSEIPIKFANKTIQDKIVLLVNKIFHESKTGNDISKIENKINLIIYKLYELTYDEVLVVDPEFGLSEQEYEAFTV